MINDDRENLKRLEEQAERAYARNKYVFTSFLSMGELSALYAGMGALSYANPVVFGGYEGAERAVVRFGSVEGYEEPFPVATLKIEPRGAKFAEELSHRDYLGAAMNTGVDRSALGDVVPFRGGAYLYCLDEMADYLSENIRRIRHTDVKCTRVERGECEEKHKVEEFFFLSSLRADCAIAAVYKLSREDALAYFKAERVFVNGKTCSKPAKELSFGDAVTVRGKGRFVLAELVGESKKGRLRCRVERDGV